MIEQIHVIRGMKQTYAQIADALNIKGVQPPSGDVWHVMTIQRIVKR